MAETLKRIRRGGDEREIRTKVASPLCVNSHVDCSNAKQASRSVVRQIGTVPVPLIVRITGNQIHRYGFSILLKTHFYVPTKDASAHFIAILSAYIPMQTELMDVGQDGC